MVGNETRCSYYHGVFLFGRECETGLDLPLHVIKSTFLWTEKLEIHKFLRAVPHSLITSESQFKQGTSQCSAAPPLASPFLPISLSPCSQLILFDFSG